MRRRPGGTQAGLVAACRLLGLAYTVVGIAADGPDGAAFTRR